MLRYTIGDLTNQAKDGLRSQQDKVDSKGSHQERYVEATKLFKSKSPKTAFDEVRRELSAHSPPGNACFYCERDRYRDIEHIRPKRHYPEHCFSWNNYVYACTICNQDAKKDTFAVFDHNNNIHCFDRSLPMDQPVPIGDPVMIDIRSEDPLEYLQLDLITGLFVCIGGNARDIKRGEFTRDLFNLDNDSLSRIRRQAVNHFRDYASRFVQAKAEKNDAEANRILQEILELPHPTVLVEMRRQSDSYPAIAALFQHLPASVGQRP